jgi:hypothetical protein
MTATEATVVEKLDLLEEKIRKTTETVRALRAQRSALEGDLRGARKEIEKLSAARTDQAESAGRMELMQQERRALAERVERMITIIEEVEAS